MVQDNRAKPGGGALRAVFGCWYLFGVITYGEGGRGGGGGGEGGTRER